jgi:hypothetical protein
VAKCCVTPRENYYKPMERIGFNRKTRKTTKLKIGEAKEEK